MTSLRILTCVYTCCAPGTQDFRGGEDVLGWNLLKQISRKHEVWAITNANDRFSIEQALQKEPLSNVHFSFVGLPRWLAPMVRFQGGIQFYYHLWQILAYLTARRLHKQVGFDLFHHITYANDWLANYIGAFLPVPYLRGPGGGAHQTPKGLQAEYSLGGRIWEKVRTVGQRVLRLDPVFIIGQSRARAILLCNRESQSMVPKRWAKKVHSFPVSGVSSEDLDHISEQQRHVPVFRILSAGSLIRVKGFGLAIKSFKEFSATHPHSQLNIAGAGPEESKLRDLTANCHLDGKVNFLGPMPRDQLLSEMVASDVFLFPSLRDGGGTVAVEAMAMGKPVICLDVGGPGMNVTEQSGIKVTPSSPDCTVHALATAIECLYLNETLRLKLGQGARDRAEQRYHWDKLGERLMQIYDHALTDPDHS